MRANVAFLAALSMVLTVAACARLQQPGEPQAPVIGLQLARGKIIADEWVAQDIDECDVLLAREVDGYARRGIESTDYVVEISGDAAATYGQLEELVEVCQRRGIADFTLKFDRSYNFTLPLAAPREGTPDVPELPPFRLLLIAGEDGSLRTLRLDNLTLGSNMSSPAETEGAFLALHQEIIARLGDTRGLGSLAEVAEVEIHADPQLKLAYLGDAYTALAGYYIDKNTFVPLAQHIHPVRWHGEREMVEEIEEFEEFELEPLVLEIPTEVEVNPADEIEEFRAAPSPDTIDDADDAAGEGGFSRARAPREAQRAKVADDAGEKAMIAGLKWIVSRQASDGGWNFNHNDKLIAAEACPDPGTAEQARNAATGMALLPLLTAGQSHREGEYKKEVHAGLQYLVKSMKVDGKIGHWNEPQGTMYAHGFAALAVCEAYAMTEDKELLAPARLAINYIAHAQDPVGGGWRYQPRQAGDTSVSALQLRVLKSGHFAFLELPKKTVLGSVKFFDSVQTKEGGQFGYTAPAEGRAGTTAMGLLSRMYLGWKKDNPDLKAGIEFLDKTGPSKSDIYYNYYATSVMYHYSGEPWQRWNSRMRELLLKSQKTDMGPAAGSWHFVAGSAGNERGGRLMCTALAVLILEAEFRDPPMYGEGDAEDEFPL